MLGVLISYFELRFYNYDTTNFTAFETEDAEPASFTKANKVFN